MTTLPLMTDDEMAALPSDAEMGFGALETARGRLPLKAMAIRARISGLAAHVTLTQTFCNALDEALEATYVFPLPAYGAVTSFQMAVDGRIIDGLLKERGEARQEYERAIEAGHRAAITEEERPDVFTLRVGNLMPGEAAEIRLTLVAPLPYCDGEATFRFPLVVAPRYIPGTPLPGPSVGDGVAPDTDAVPDASRITPPVLLPGFPNPVALSLGVEIDRSGLGAGDVRSSLHAIVEGESGERWQRVAIRPGERLDRDFILRFRVADESVRSALLLHPDSDDKGGTYQLTLTPPIAETKAAIPRDVVFVIDRSGSMGGWKMVAARRALGRMVDTLAERDRFAIIAFDHHIERPAAFSGEKLVPATDRNRFRAIEFLAKLEARGGTEMARPLNEAAEALAGGYADRDPVLVLVTDGQVGNEDQILRALAPRLKRSRIFTLGIDRAINAGFLRRLAALGGGACELVESEDRLDEVMARVHRRIDTPVLTEVLIDGEELELELASQIPSRLPGLFAGAPLTVYGRYRGRPKGRVVVRATDSAGDKWSETVEATTTDLEAIGPLWARGQLRQLEDRYSVDSRDPGLAERIVSISLKFGVLCRFTAFVAVDRSEVVNAGGDPHRILQPVEVPSGWQPEIQVQGAPRTLSIDHVAALRSPGAAPAGAPPEQALGGSFLGLIADDEAEAPLAYAVPEARSKRARKGGIKRAAMTVAMDVSSRFGGDGKSASEKQLAEVRPGLSGYRSRAQRLLERLEQARAGDRAARLKALGRAAVGLRALLDDADSVGLDSPALSALGELVEDVRGALSAPESLDDDALAELFERVQRELEAFTGGEGDETQPSQRGGDFWK